MVSLHTWNVSSIPRTYCSIYAAEHLVVFVLKDVSLDCYLINHLRFLLNGLLFSANPDVGIVGNIIFISSLVIFYLLLLFEH